MTNSAEEKKLIAVYGRVSSSNQENEGTIETQLSSVREFADKNNYTIVEQYLDEGWSGDNLIRPSLDRLRSDAIKRNWQAVLIYDPDRLARRYSYQELVTDELKEKGIEIIYVTTPAPQNGIEKILFGVQGLFAEYERAKISERFRLGKVRKAKEGNIIASEAPYGYTFIPKRGKKGEPGFMHGYYEINPQEAAIVKEIFSWIADEGLTINRVLLRLQELNIQPRKSNRGVWARSTIGHMLRNRTYIGEGHWGSTNAVVPIKPLKKDVYRKIKKSSRKKRPQEEWIIIPTPKIIEEEIFNTVAQKLKENYENSRRNRKSEYLLSGKIFCVCGARRVGEGSIRTQHWYYRCTDRLHRFPLPRECGEAGINAKVADSVVWQKIEQLMCSEELLNAQLKRWKIKNINNPLQNEKRSELIIGEIKKLRMQEDRFVKAYGIGAISLEQFRENADPLREKTRGLEKSLDTLKTTKRKIGNEDLPSREQIKEFVQKAKEKLANLSFEKRKQIMDNIIKRATGTRNKLSVYGNMPVNIFEHVSLCPEYRNRQDATGYLVEEKKNSKATIPIRFDAEIISGRWIKNKN